MTTGMIFYYSPMEKWEYRGWCIAEGMTYVGRCIVIPIPDVGMSGGSLMILFMYVLLTTWNWL
jgi:hypothetical protein